MAELLAHPSRQVMQALVGPLQGDFLRFGSWFFSKMLVGSRGESTLSLWGTQKAWAAKALFPLSVLARRQLWEAKVGAVQQEFSVISVLATTFGRRCKVEAGWLVRFCASVRALVGKGRFCFAPARQGWRRRFRQSGLATATVLAVAPQVGCAGFGELGRVGWGTAVLCGRGFGRETAVFASPWPGKAGANVVGKGAWARAEVLPFVAWAGWQSFWELRVGQSGKAGFEYQSHGRETAVLC